MKKYAPPVVLVAVLIIAAGLVWKQAEQTAGENGSVLYGNVDIREVQLAFRQSGRVETLFVDEGDQVQAGDLLAELDSGPLEDALAISQAELLVATSTLEKFRSGNRKQEITRGKAAVAQARAALKLAQVEFQRQLDLKAKGVASQQALDTATTRKEEAEAALSSARESLSLLEEGARNEDIKAAEARVAAATAVRAQAQTALDDTKLLAPSSGVLLARMKEPGSMVSAAVPVVTLSLTDPVYIRAYIPETKLSRVSPGTRVWINSDSTAKTFTGHVGFVSPKAEFTPKSVETTELRTDLVYRLRIIVDESAGMLLQGMPVTVHLQQPSPK